MAEELKDRNKKIWEEKDIKGASYRDLSLKYMLSMNRIFQIVQKERIKQQIKELTKNG